MSLHSLIALSRGVTLIVGLWLALAACAPAPTSTSLPQATPMPTAQPSATVPPPTLPPPTATPTTPSPTPSLPTPTSPLPTRPRPTPRPAGSVEERIRRVENGFVHDAAAKQGQPETSATIRQRMDNYNVPGLSLAVINNYQVEWAKAYGVREQGKPDPVTTETLFQTASIGKPLTALAALRLVQAGQLDLDSDVNQKLVSWKIPDSPYTRATQITLRRLLSHTAAMRVSGFRGYFQGEPAPTLLQILNGQPPANSPAIVVEGTPGREYAYSGGGYVVIQQLLMDMTGQSYPDLMRDLVFQPTGMTHTLYLPPDEQLRPLAASGHTAKGVPLRGGWVIHPEMGPAGGWSTPTDLAHFAIALARAWRGDGDAVLSVDLAREMVKTQVEHPTIGQWGLGVQVGGEGEGRYFSHGGGNQGFRARLLMLPATGQGLIVMTNADSGGELQQETLLSVAREYGWPGFGN